MRASRARPLASAHTHARARAVMEKWKKISYVGLPVVFLFGAFTMYKHFAHHHEAGEAPAYPHIKIRTKPFPWGSKDCDLFDLACKREAFEKATE